MKLRSNYAKAARKKRPKLCCVWISTCSSYKLLYFLLICSCEIPQKKICGLWLDTPTIRLKAKICNSRLWQQYILSSFCRHWCLRLVTRHIGVKSQMKSHFNKYCHLNDFPRFSQSCFLSTQGRSPWLMKNFIISLMIILSTFLFL